MLKNLGYNIKVETHGSIGIKNQITETDIKDVDLVIIAVSAGASDLHLERFNDKPLYQVEITKVVKDADSVIKEAFEKAKPFGSVKKTNSGEKSDDLFSTDKKGFMKHIMSGVGYMVPFVVFGGIMIAISAGVSQIIYGPGKNAPYPNFLWFMNQAGVIGFQLMIPILGGFIANSIAGRAAIAPAMITSFVANATIPNPNGAGTITIVYPIAGLGTSTPAGFLGALLIGPAVGYTVKWMITWKIPKTIAPIMPIFVIPILVTFVFSFIFIYGIGAPIGWVMGKFGEAIKAMPLGAMAGIGFLLGAMGGFDMGGPVNKIAFLTASGLINDSSPDQNAFMGALAAAIPVAPLGMALTTFIFYKYFNENERSLGITALILGFFGISEGAIPFAVRDPKRAIIANVIGSGVAGCIAGAFFVTDMAAHGGPIVGILGAIGSSRYDTWVGILVYFIAIIVGSFITCLMYGGLLTLQRKGIKIFKKSDKKNKDKNEITKKDNQQSESKKNPSKSIKPKVKKVISWVQNQQPRYLLKASSY